MFGRAEDRQAGEGDVGSGDRRDSASSGPACPALESETERKERDSEGLEIWDPANQVWSGNGRARI